MSHEFTVRQARIDAALQEIREARPDIDVSRVYDLLLKIGASARMQALGFDMVEEEIRQIRIKHGLAKPIDIPALLQFAREHVDGGNIHDGPIVPAWVVKQVQAAFWEHVDSKDKATRQMARHFAKKVGDYHRAYANCGIYLRDLEQCFAEDDLYPDTRLNAPGSRWTRDVQV